MPSIGNLPNPEAFRDGLIRLGLSELSANEFLNNGITSLNKLRCLTTDALDMLIKQIHRDNQGQGLFIPFFSQQYIRAIRFWTGRMHILGLPYKLTDVTEGLAETWNEKTKIELEAAKAPSELVKMPKTFKKKDSKWRTWKESVMTYLHLKTGQASLPLAYIIREYDHPLPIDHYATTHDQLVAGAILHGPEHNTNNSMVFDLLQSLTLAGPAWAWINHYKRVRDGRNAWKALIAYYEGDSMQTRSKQQCYEAISKAVYKGHTRNFDFASYVTIHQ